MNTFKYKTAVILIIAALTNLITLSILISNSATTASVMESEGSYLRITVTDGVSGTPIQDATVCIPETNQYYNTGKSGSTRTIPVPYLPNTNYESIMPRDWGDVSVLVYKDGYATFIIFYIMVTDGKTRHLNITLYPSDDPDEIQTLIESPNTDWVNNMVNKYKK